MLTSLALSSYLEFSMSILKLHVKRAQKMSTTIRSQILFFFNFESLITQKIKVKIFSSVTIILKLNMEHMKVSLKLEFLT